MPDMSDKNLITEQDVRLVNFGETLKISAKALVTPLAADVARERRVRIERDEPAQRPTKKPLIALGADHGGFEMKESLKGLLRELGFEYRDFGTNSTAAVDYPDFAEAIAVAVARGVCDLGIMIDGAGIGSCMVANKVPGVRAAM